MEKVDISQDVNELNHSVCEAILGAAKQTIQRNRGRSKKKIAPWWTRECANAIQSQNKAFKMVKTTHNF